MNSKLPDVKKPPYWTDVYATGASGEYEFFIALARDQLTWRTTYQIAKASGLSEKRVEEIIEKYLPKGMIFPHDREDSKWAYWEKVPERLEAIEKSLAELDQDQRINRHMKKEGTMTAFMTARTPPPAPPKGKTVNGIFLEW